MRSCEVSGLLRELLQLALALVALCVTAEARALVAQQDQESGEPPSLVPEPEAPVLIVRDIRVEGLEFYDESVVLNALEQKVGEPLRLDSVRRSMGALYETYKILVAVHYEELLDGIVLILECTESPADFEPRFVGHDEIGIKEILEWADLDRQPVVYLSEVERIRLRLIEAYKRHGFHFIEIDVATKGGSGVGDPPDVIFEIQEGPEVRCVGVEVVGNENIPDTGWGVWRGGLRRLADFQTKGRGLLRWWGKIFDEDVLEADMVALKNVYRQRGWLDVEAHIENLEFNRARDKVRVTVTVDEGPLYRVRELQIRAYERLEGQDEEDFLEVPLAFPEVDLLELCSMGPGTAFEYGAQLRDRSRLRTYYGERGYIDADYFERPETGFADGWRWLEPYRVVDPVLKEVQVTYRMLQGRPRSVREVRLRGNSHTRDKVVRRELSVLPGERANLTEMERSRNRLRGTGYFSDPMDPAHVEVIMRLYETDDPDEVDVEYTVNEGRVVDFTLTGGVTSDVGLIGRMSLSMRNFDLSTPPGSAGSLFGDIYRKEAFHGNGELLLLDLAPGTEVSSGGVRYRHPDLFGSHFNRWSADVSLRRTRQFFRSFRQGVTRAEVEVGRAFGFNHFVEFGPAYATSRVSDLDPDDVLPDTLIDSHGRRRYQGLGLDYRYQDLDNRRVPSEGVDFYSRNTYYGGVLGGDEDFTKSELSFDWYIPFGENQEDARPGLYVALGGGVAYARGDTDTILYGERFFLGGASTMRGFDFRGVGPFVDENGKQSDIPIGGETFARGTFELRFPLYTVPQPGTAFRQEMFRGTIFMDWGVLDPNGLELAVNEVRVSAGFGFGLAYPIPLTFNFGWPLEKGVGDDPEVFSFRLTIR